MKFTSLENLQYFLNKLSYVSKESGLLNSIITSYLNDFKRDVVKIVSSLPSEGETGVLYLVPQGNNQFIEYYYNKNSNSYIQLGSSVFDVSVDSQLSNASENTLQNKVISNILDTKLNASQLVNALNNTSSETPQSQVLYDAFGDKIDSEDFLKISNSDINSLFDILIETGKLACSKISTWIVDDDGNLYGCGSGSYGLQGSGGTSSVKTFTKRAGNVKSVKCSNETTWYLTEDGDLYGCGKNDRGQQGSGDTSNVLTFTKRAENVKDFECSNFGTWYLTEDGDLYGTGENENGQQGSGDTTDVLAFTKRAENVKKIKNTNNTTWFIDNNYNLYGCGDNANGQQGSGDTTDVLAFTKRAENVKDIACGNFSTWYIDNNNNLYGCGRNDNFQQGKSIRDYEDVLTFTKRAENVKNIKINDFFVWYLTVDNVLYETGYGPIFSRSGYGLGIIFVKISENVKDFKCYLSENRTEGSLIWFLTKDGELYGSGYNRNGQQGSGNTSDVGPFRKRAENVKDFCVSSETTFYITENGELYGAGQNFDGQQGNGMSSQGISTFTKISI